MTRAAESRLVERFVAMGTRIECHLFGPAASDEIATALRSAVEAVDDALTIHRVSPTTMLNDRLRFQGEAAVDDPVLWQALLMCDGYHGSTGGLFDVSAGMAEAGWDAIEIDRANARLRASRPVAVDFGGIGKGIALDRCRAILAGAHSSSALISLGESSILVHGEHPLGGEWPLTIPHPNAADRALVALSLRDRCLSISSTVGRANGDTVAPDSGMPITAPMTAVAVDPSGAKAEAFSTAMMVGDAGQRAAMIAAAACEALHLFDLSNDNENAADAGGVLVDG